ncbi:MAG: hypothetical protein B7Y15_08610 [Bacteroidetes bacterium 24-39-8]|jgi:hypothetical protein|nr:MAG: hypothetical protein B7Y15_08610 [Bacteroidetes bacterium 24-39-8]HQR94818.1 hypothetical protein [Sediminibacterium sp.]HQS55276.1 hypothetical protein [Sediminibacterium sp.]
MSNLGFQELIILIIPLLFLYIIIKVIIKVFGEMGRRRRYAEAQIRLLMHIAAKQGVDPDKIAEIVAEADLPTFANS